MNIFSRKKRRMVSRLVLASFLVAALSSPLASADDASRCDGTYSIRPVEEDRSEFKKEKNLFCVFL